MGVFAETCILVNRTKRVLKVRFDGQDHLIQPGENVGFPVIAVDHARQQNPIMGSQHPYDPTDYKSLVGVKGTGDVCTPIDNDPDEVERVDRNKVFGKYSKANTRRVSGGGVSGFEARAGVAGETSVADFSSRD